MMITVGEKSTELMQNIIYIYIYNVLNYICI